jgi:hypothetical protein
MGFSQWRFDPAAVLAFAERQLFRETSRAVVKEWVRRSIGAWTELGFDQERRLFVEEYATERHMPFVQPHLVLVRRLTEPLDVAVLQEQLDAFVRRHPLLMAAFRKRPSTEVPEEPVDIPEQFHLGVGPVGLYEAVAARPTAVSVLVRPVASSDLFALDAEVVDAVSAAARAPFDLAKPPFLRAAIVEGRASQKLLVLIGDRLVFDWRRMGCLVAWLHEPRCDAGSLITAPGNSHMARKRRFRRLVRESLHYWYGQWRDWPKAPWGVFDLPHTLPEPLFNDVARLGHQFVSLPSDLAASLRACAEAMMLPLSVLLGGAVLAMLQEETQRQTLSLWVELLTPLGDTPWRFTTASHFHVVSVDLSRSCSLRDVILAFAVSHAAAASHAMMPVDGLWLAARRSWGSKAPSAAFVHFASTSHFASGCSSTDCPLPLLETHPGLGLQFYSRDSGQDIWIGAVHLATRLSDTSVRQMLSSLSQILALLGREHLARPSRAPQTDEEGSNRETAMAPSSGPQENAVPSF